MTENTTVTATAKRTGNEIAIHFTAGFAQVAALGAILSRDNYEKLHAVLKPGDAVNFTTDSNGAEMGKFRHADSAIAVLRLLDEALREGSFFTSDRNISHAAPFTLEGVRKAGIDIRAIAQELNKGKQP